MDKNFFKKIRIDIEKALEEVEKENNITLRVGTISYEDIKATIKLEMELKGEEVNKIKEDEFNRYAEIYGLPKNSLGKEVVIEDKKFTLEGFDLNKKKYCVILQNVNTGARCGITLDYAKLLLK